MAARGGKARTRARPGRGAATASLVLVAAQIAGLVSPASGQVVPPERLIRPGPEETRPALPEFREEPPPDFVLPPVPPPRERDRLGEVPVAFVREVRLEGNTIFSDRELTEITAPYVGRAVTTEDLLDLRDALTRHYVERGYINSGAVIPDQLVEDGVIRVEIVEGRLDEIVVGGAVSLTPAFVEDRVRLGAGPPLNIEDLRDQVQLLLADPAIERVDARLGPGLRQGESRLEIEVVEAPRWLTELRFANDRSPSVGAERGELALTFGNVLGRSDPLRFQFGVSEGVRDFEVAYSVPLTARDLRLFGAAEIASSEVVERPFSEIDVESDSRALRAGLSYPLIRTLDDELLLGLTFERKRSTTFLLGRRFSFSEGVQDGRSDISALRLVQQWQHRSQNQVLALRSTESFGLDLLGATRNPGDVPDGRFFAWLAQAQYARRLTAGGLQANLRADLQLTPDPLLPIERIAIGGVDTVRGYRENQLVRDNGWDASAELRIPLGRLQIPGLSPDPEDGLVQLAPFVDAGGGWNNRGGTPDPKVIWSLGAGLRWQPNPGLFGRLEVGVPLRSVPRPDERNLQDYGIHFELRAVLY